MEPRKPKTNLEKRMIAAVRKKEALLYRSRLEDTLNGVRGMNLAASMKNWALVDVNYVEPEVEW